MSDVDIVVNELVYNVTLAVTVLQQDVEITITEDSLVTIEVTNVDQEIQLVAATGGVKGDKGDSAYQVWLDEGNIGTEQDFLDSLRPFNITMGATPPVDPQVNDLWIDTSS